MAKTKNDYLKMVGGAVKKVRNSYKPKMTQEGLGSKIGITGQGVYQIERGQYFPEINTLVEIAKATKTNLIIDFKTDEQLKAEKELNDLINKNKTDDAS